MAGMIDMCCPLVISGGEIQTEIRELHPGEEHPVRESGEILCHLSEDIAQIPTRAEAGEQEGGLQRKPGDPRFPLDRALTQLSGQGSP